MSLQNTPYLTVNQTANLLQKTVITIHRYIRNGLKANKVSDCSLLIHKDDLKAFIHFGVSINELNADQKREIQSYNIS